MTSPFAKAADKLRANGYSIIPLREKSKCPIYKNWQQHCLEHADERAINLWKGWPGANIGVCLGAASGIVAFDFDSDVDGLHSEILKCIGDTPVKKAGRLGYTGFYRFGNERTAPFARDGVHVLDVLANGRQTVLPPSIHPEGMPYRWMTDRTLENTRPDELPEITPGSMALVMKLFRGEQKPVRPPHPAEPFDFNSEPDIAEALRYIPPDISYPDWRNVGMAIKDKLGEGGFSLWDSWSAGGQKYAGTVATRKIWDSFRGVGIHIGTLFYEAFKFG